MISDEDLAAIEARVNPATPGLLLNWHAAIGGNSNAMRSGIEDPTT